jgi:hypothetical protein
VKKGIVNEAIECLRKAIKINEQFIEAAEKDEDLATLKNNDRFLHLIKKGKGRPRQQNE